MATSLIDPDRIRWLTGEDAQPSSGDYMPDRMQRDFVGWREALAPTVDGPDEEARTSGQD